MKRNILIIAAAIISMMLNACTINLDGESLGGKTIKGDGNIITRNIDVTVFNEISTSLPATVNFTIADNYSCTVNVDENLFDYLDIKVKDNELLMGKRKEDKNTSLRATKFVIEVTAPSLKDINLAGSGTFNANSPLEAEKFEANVAGSGDIVFHKTVTAEKVELNVAGSGDLVCNELIADRLDCNVVGSGDLKVVSGTVREAEAGVAGCQCCWLWRHQGAGQRQAHLRHHRIGRHRLLRQSRSRRRQSGSRWCNTPRRLTTTKVNHFFISL